MIAVLAAAVVAGASLLAGPSSGRAADGVDLSRDGVHWAAEIDDAPFLPGLAWTPGDTRSSTFRVRNDTNDTADVLVTLTRPTTAMDRWMTVSAGTPGDTVDTIAPGSVDVLVVHDLGAGDQAVVTLRASLSDTAPEGARVDGDVLGYRVAIDDRGGFAASARLELAPLFLGLAMIGAVGVVARRRNRLGRD